jgi:hypothetical protein
MATTMTGTERLEYMRQALKEGGTVFHKGRQLFTEKDLPTLTDLAVNDEERKQASQDLARRRQELEQEALRLEAESAPGTATGGAAIGTTEVPPVKPGRQNLSPQSGGKEGGGKEGGGKA